MRGCIIAFVQGTGVKEVGASCLESALIEPIYSWLVLTLLIGVQVNSV